ILMKNAQVEFRITSVDRGEAKSLLDKVLSLLDKKVRRSLKMTENFKNKDLKEYLDMANKINNARVITETEKYPGEMIGMINENVNIPDNLYKYLTEYYFILNDELYGDPHGDLYDEEPLTQAMEKVITQFGRLKFGAEIYGSKIAPRYENRSYIRAKFLAFRDNTEDIYPGKIQFFFQHKFKNKTYHLAY
ncbi:1673_t:CDS:1, partial [Dentiscutata heterogama]